MYLAYQLNLLIDWERPSRLLLSCREIGWRTDSWEVVWKKTWTSIYTRITNFADVPSPSSSVRDYRIVKWILFWCKNVELPLVLNNQKIQHFLYTLDLINWVGGSISVSATKTWRANILPVQTEQTRNIYYKDITFQIWKKLQANFIEPIKIIIHNSRARLRE